MSLGAWGDEGDVGPDGLEGYVSEERAQEMFRLGAQAMREMLARFVDQCSDDKPLVNSIRNNWHPGWGKDPGKLDGEIPADAWLA